MLTQNEKKVEILEVVALFTVTVYFCADTVV